MERFDLILSRNILDLKNYDLPVYVACVIYSLKVANVILKTKSAVLGSVGLSIGLHTVYFHEALGLIGRLQSVQNKCLMYLHWREPDRPLNLLRLHPLVVRREVADVVFLYKILNFVVVCPPLLERIAFRLPSGTRSRRLFELSHLNRNYLQFSSVPRILRLGNEVCSEVDFFCNRLGALRRAVLTVRLETFESE
ncbi:hypothetical protein J6590_056572 [Homalodisca vitripennis]|nr:hypothetical protein J6590_056572 [Homalodisca vitripennis]